jgi:anti-sigma factor RsiW
MGNPHVLDQIDGYLDREFDLATSLAIERHLEACPQCRTEAEQRRALLARIAAEATRFSAPDTLRRRIQRVVAAEAGAAQGRAALGPAGQVRRWAVAAAALLLVGGLSSGTTAYLLRGSGAPGTEEQVVASHVRSLLVEGRLTDVASSDEHTVKPWFNHRLDFAPPVDDWTTRGFPLVGGRLDYVDRRTVAALVYRHRQHLINVFVWPDRAARARAAELSARQGYAVVHWSDGAMTYWAVSDLNAAELREFCESLRAAAAKPS